MVIVPHLLISGTATSAGDNAEDFQAFCADFLASCGSPSRCGASSMPSPDNSPASVVTSGLKSEGACLNLASSFTPARLVILIQKTIWLQMPAGS